MHWHINAAHPHSNNTHSIHTLWTIEEAWKRADLMDEARREDNLAYIITVTECESLECLIEEMAK
jgi:hypothetical protein